MHTQYETTTYTITIDSDTKLFLDKVVALTGKDHDEIIVSFLWDKRRELEWILDALIEKQKQQ